MLLNLSAGRLHENVKKWSSKFRGIHTRRVITIFESPNSLNRIMASQPGMYDSQEVLLFLIKLDNNCPTTALWM